MSENTIFYSKDTSLKYPSNDLDHVFGGSTTMFYGDGGKDGYSDRYSWLNNPSVFQWLEGTNG